MLGFGSKSILFAFVALLPLSGPAQAQSLSQQSLQRIADDAALAAVQLLGSGGAPADAVTIAQQTAAVAPGVVGEVSASSTDLSVTVKLSGADANAPAVSTARYVPPQQPAVWNWAPRQRFAVTPSPVVVGSYCLRDCEPDALR